MFGGAGGGFGTAATGSGGVASMGFAVSHTTSNSSGNSSVQRLGVLRTSVGIPDVIFVLSFYFGETAPLIVGRNVWQAC